MLNLEPELRSAAAAASLDLISLEPVARIERRELTPILPELRLASYGGVALVIGAVGTFVARHLEQIGPVAVAALIGVPALFLYAFVFQRKRQNGRLTGLQDYLALLASLLVSADVAYIESQFHLFDGSWQNHLLILAAIHGVVAYLLETRLVLTLSLVALVGWFGVTDRFRPLFDSTVTLSRQAFIAAAALLLWRVIHTRFSRLRDFEAPFDHLIVNLALGGAMGLVCSSSYEFVGQLLVAIFCAATLYAARHFRRESFAFYAFLYELSAISISVVRHGWDQNEILISFYLIVVSFAAIAGLFIIHAKWKLEEA
jgi:hypothetical protein